MKNNQTRNPKIAHSAHVNGQQPDRAEPSREVDADPNIAESNGGARFDLRKFAPLIIAGLGILVLAAVWMISSWRFGQTHVSTDDAYVTGDLVNISPTISGRLAELLVDEGAHVTKGQVLARLSDDVQEAAIREAEAKLLAAQTQVPQAESAYRLAQQNTAAQIHKAQAEVGTQQAKTSGAQEQVSWQAETYQNQVAGARSQEAAAEAQAERARADVVSAQAAVNTAKEGVTGAERAADEAQARVDAAKAESDRAAADAARYKSLVDQEVVSRQQYDSIRATATSAQAQYSAAKEAAARARAGIAQARQAVKQAEAQQKAFQKAASAAEKNVQVARSAIGLARANRMQIGIQKSNVVGSQQQTAQAQADLATAQAQNQDVELKRQQIATAQAQVKQAEAALENAKISLQHTLIKAPADGSIVKKTANPGSALSPGQTILTMTSGDSVWVSANFKETQLTHVRPGQPAEVEVDSFPGRTFKGTVEMISQATGASTSLLPPDNATGNFTKVVQRIAVRIRLIPSVGAADQRYAQAGDIRNLRQGMSATATIELRR